MPPPSADDEIDRPATAFGAAEASGPFEQRQPGAVALDQLGHLGARPVSTPFVNRRRADDSIGTTRAGLVEGAKRKIVKSGGEAFSLGEEKHASNPAERWKTRAAVEIFDIKPFPWVLFPWPFLIRHRFCFQPWLNLMGGRMFKSIAQSVCFTASLVFAICISVAASLPAHADVLAQAHSDLETVAFCSSTGATSSSCSVMDATSSANLATGVLAAQANCCDYAGLSGGLASALAKFSDTVTLVIPNGYTASTIPSVTFNFTVSGADIGISGPALSAQHPAATISDFLQVLPATPFAFTGGSATGCDSTDPLDFCGTHNSPLDLSVTLKNIPTASPVFTFTAQLQVSATGFDPGQGVFPKGSGFTDAMDPGQLDIVLPQGFTFTSGSRVLLSQAAPIPEPSSVVLLASGLIGLGLARRRRKHSAL